MTNLTPILEAARQAAKLCYEVQQRHIVKSEKQGREPVTIADYGSQAIICRAIKQHFPDDAVMAEESGQQFRELVADEQKAQIVALISEILGVETNAEEIADWLDFGAGKEARQMWVIDPIDGTKGFLAERHYVIAVGLMHDRKPVGGVLAAPAYPNYEGGALFYAIDGKAYMESLSGTGEDRKEISASENADTTQLRTLESVEKSHAGMEQMAEVRELAGIPDDLLIKIDSMEKYARIAAGDGDLYLRLPRLNSDRGHSIWDHAAGVAIVFAAGGKATDVDGTPLDFSEGTTLKNYGVVVSNGRAHDAIIDAIQKVINKDTQ